MNRVSLRFISFLAAITTITIIILIVAEHYHDFLPLGDYYNIASIIQGTVGVTVSFEGALVAIRLAQLGTAIVEKEKSARMEKHYTRL